MKVLLLKYAAYSLLIMILITYSLGWIDLISNQQLSGDWLNDFFKSLTYYVSWVLPYWWVIILIGVIVLTLIGIGVKLGISKLKK
jgi:purine-cytosine permease-like protein